MDEAICGPLGFNYVAIYSELFAEQVLMTLVFFICWAIYLIYLLGQTADVYFSPSLAAICDKLQLSYDVAGVTFLAFGNGAPDVFSSIAAIFSDGDSNILIGLGALLGASIFILTIVVGSVTASNKATAARLAYTRDIVFHLMATSTVVYCAFRQQITLWDALGLLALYALYVFVAFLLDRYSKQKKSAKKPALSLNQEGFQPTESDDFPGATLSAFWHSPQDLSELADFHRQGHAGSVNCPEEVGTQSNTTVPIVSPPPSTGNGASETISHFGHTVFADYFKSDAQEKLEILKEPLLFEQEGNGSGRFWGSRSFQRWKWRRQLQRALNLRAGGDQDAEAFVNKSVVGKVVTLLVWPVVLARNLTIPIAEDEGWSRLYASCQVLLCPLFLGFTSGTLTLKLVGPIPQWVVLVVLAAPASIAVRLRTHRSKAPVNKVYTVVSLVSSFVLCIAWIYVIAAEVVAVFQALGWVTGIPTNILALTFLAWGNSVGDWVTNLSVARNGYANMALAGCYGGPLFNLLMGLGLPLVWQCIIQYPQPVSFSLDSTTSTTIVFLYVVFLLSLAFMSANNFKYTSKMGVTLLIVYIMYTVCSVILLAFGKS